MLRGTYTIEDARYSVELRTMLAYPYGTFAYLTDPYVLRDIATVYPAVWQSIHFMNQLFFRSQGAFNQPHEALRKWRVPRAVFNLLIQLGRQEVSEPHVLREAKKCYLSISS